MPGLRRVTLNLNTEVGDKGARELADILRDDVCLKGTCSCQEMIDVYEDIFFLALVYSISSIGVLELTVCCT